MLAAGHILDGKSPYIHIDNISLYRYSPLFAIVMIPFKLLNPSFTIYIWTLVGILFFYWSLLTFLIEIKPSHLTSNTVLVLSINFVIITGMINNLNFLQSNMYFMGALLISLVSMRKKHYLTAGILLGLITSIKLFSIALALVLLLEWKPRYWIGFFGSLILCFLLPVLFFGWEVNLQHHIEWFSLLFRDMHNTFHGDVLYYHSVKAFLEHHFSMGYSPFLNLIPLTLGILIALLYRSHFRIEQSNQLVILLALIVSYILLFNPRTESATMILLVPSLLTLFIYSLAFTQNHKARLTDYIIWGVLFLVFFLSCLSGTDAVPKPIRMYMWRIQGKTMGILLLFLFTWTILVIPQLKKRYYA